MIDYPRGLAGHSDGDVVSHALIDALLGAADLGDIGSLFPSDDEQYRGASSLDLLWEAYREVREPGWELVNADCVLIGEEPRIGAVRAEMGERLCRRAGRRERPRDGARDDDRPPRASRDAAKGSPRRPSRCSAALARQADEVSRRRRDETVPLERADGLGVERAARRARSATSSSVAARR